MSIRKENLGWSILSRNVTQLWREIKLAMHDQEEISTWTTTKMISINTWACSKAEKQNNRKRGLLWVERQRNLTRSDWKSDSLSLTSGPRVRRARQRLLKLPRGRKPDLCQLPRAFWGEGGDDRSGYGCGEIWKIGAVVVIRAVFHPNLNSQRAGQITLHDSAQSSPKPKS